MAIDAAVDICRPAQRGNVRLGSLSGVDDWCPVTTSLWAEIAASCTQCATVGYWRCGGLGQHREFTPRRCGAPIAGCRLETNTMEEDRCHSTEA